MDAVRPHAKEKCSFQPAASEQSAPIPLSMTVSFTHSKMVQAAPYRYQVRIQSRQSSLDGNTLQACKRHAE